MTRHRRRANPANPPPPPEPTDWQAQAVRDLTDVATRMPADVQLLGEPLVEPDGTRHVRFGLSTAGLTVAPKGVRFEAVEEFTITLDADGTRPPTITVDHYRFLGVAHVMSGLQICLYLDIAREWDPGAGVRGVLDRLWKWMDDASADRFDADTALFHPVGGVPHLTEGTPTIVVRELPDRGRHVRHAFLRRRSETRFDLTVTAEDESNDLFVPVVRLRRDLPVGAGHDVLADLLHRLDVTQGLRPDWPDSALTASSHALFARPAPLRLGVAEHAVTGHVSADNDCRLEPLVNPWELRDRDFRPTLVSPAVELAETVIASVSRNPMGSQQYVVLAVPHPSGGADHLLCLRLSSSLADHLRAAVAEPSIEVDPYRVVQLSPRMAMEWCHLSDERSQVTTRRDVARPVERLRGRHVHIWGVGGLGSWIAEFVVRAGAAKVVIHDPGHVTGGLLVRQNYVEDDIGAEKAEALVRRLRAIRDDVEVTTLSELTTEGGLADLMAADLFIDATISRAVTRGLDELVQMPGRRGVFAQVATDARTGSLGIVTVLAPTAEPDETGGDEAVRLTLTDIDRAAGAAVGDRAELEAYRVFWEEPLAGDEFVPTRGCSVPTFHGSAADLASVSGSILNFAALHVGRSESGTHLFALPHAGVETTHEFLLHRPARPAVATEHVA